MAAMMVSKTLFRAYHFEVASTMVHGAYSDSVSSSISSVAARYSSYFLCRAQSASVTRHASSGSASMASNRLFCSFLLMCRKELQDDRAVVGQHALEFDDVAVGLAPRLLGDGALDALLQHAAVPAVIEDDHLAAVGDLQPEAPQPGPLLLVGARRGDGIELEAARIEPLGQRADGRSLARGVPAFEDDHGGHMPGPSRPFRDRRGAPASREAALVLFPGELLLEVDILQHKQTFNSTQRSSRVGRPSAQDARCSVAAWRPRVYRGPETSGDAPRKRASSPTMRSRTRV